MDSRSADWVGLWLNITANWFVYSEKIHSLILSPLYLVYSFQLFFKGSRSFLCSLRTTRINSIHMLKVCQNWKHNFRFQIMFCHEGLYSPLYLSPLVGLTCRTSSVLIMKLRHSCIVKHWGRNWLGSKKLTSKKCCVNNIPPDDAQNSNINIW